MEYQQEINCYRKHKNLRLASSELNIPLPTLYWRLKKAGETITGDKSRYGSDKDKLASLAEDIFQKIVPYAENQNEKKFQNKFDFLVKDLKVEIKASSLKKGSCKSDLKRWAFSLKKQEYLADFFICFGFDDAMKVQLILFVPFEIARYYSTITLSENGGKWDQYSISEKELKEFFDNI